MLFPAYKESVRIDRIKKLDTDLFFFRNDEGKPFAYRSSGGEHTDVSAITSKDPISSIGAFSLYEKGGEVYCIYDGARKVSAKITPSGKSDSAHASARKIEEYLKDAYRLDPYAISAQTALEGFENLVFTAAELCGCLTDVGRDTETNFHPRYAVSSENVNCEYIALSLPIIALMFRRISALRGFNFKVTLKDSLPCLIFSAKVLFDDEEAPREPSDISEYSALCDIFGDEGLIIGGRIKESDEITESGKAIYKLSLAVCPQTFDPRGILRAPAWRAKVKNIIDELDVDIEGKY